MRWKNRPGCWCRVPEVTSSPLPVGIVFRRGSGALTSGWSWCLYATQFSPHTSTPEGPASPPGTGSSRLAPLCVKTGGRTRHRHGPCDVSGSALARVLYGVGCLLLGFCIKSTRPLRPVDPYGITVPPLDSTRPFAKATSQDGMTGPRAIDPSHLLMGSLHNRVTWFSPRSS